MNYGKLLSTITNDEDYMKQLLQVLFLCISSFVCVSCTFFSNVSISGYSPSLVENEDRMLETGDSYFYKNRDVTLSEGCVEYSFTRFCGLETVYRVRCEEPQEISITINTDVNTNRYKVVLVNDTLGQVLTLSQGSAETSQTLRLQPGRYRLKVVGYDADGFLHISLTVGQGVEVDLCDESLFN
ncbi:MAG: hypothetical protein EOM15_09990 [Spirochaetia bacterium]|nr:hypothetical protein [Spirochaetia bacterium]